LVITVLSAGDLAAGMGDEESNSLQSAQRSDLVIVEDLQFLAVRAAEPLARLLDDLERRRIPIMVTASTGPQGLELPARLSNRLVRGLVVGMEPPGLASRRALLENRARGRQMALPPEVLDWLAEHVIGGGRQLDGALTRLEALARLHARPLDVAAVAEHFREEANATAPTVERIAERVGGHFRVAPRQLLSSRRNRDVLLPRQVGMYLARQLTRLSLEQIGAYFGGRDHSTVRHACRKVELALAADAALSGTIRQLQAGLG
jgi:chromosomal replication initiator protein